jgi:hypothetical protein
LSSHIPRKQFINSFDRIVSDMRQHMAQVCLRIDAIELDTDDQRLHGGSPLAAAVGAEEILVSERDAAQRVLGDVVRACLQHAM